MNFSLKSRPLQFLTGLLFIFAFGPATAGHIVVTNTNDSGPGSLRQAMLDALADPGPNEITFAASADGVIKLASPLPDLLTSGGALIVTGNGVGSTILDGDGQFRFFSNADFQNDLSLTLRNMTLRNGRAEGSQGGAIRIRGLRHTVNIDTLRFLDNSASFDGGAIDCQCNLKIGNSTFSGNDSGAFGGALSMVGGTIQVSNSTLVGNRAVNASAVYANGEVDIRLFNVTITGNQSLNIAILLDLGARLSMSNTLVAGNTGTDLLARSGGTFEVADSFNNIIGSQLDAGFVDGENNNQVGVDDPLVGPLGDYGGPIPTAPLLPGSPAIDAGDNAACADSDTVGNLDQRGIARPQGSACDIGAFESRGFSLALVSGDNQATTVETSFDGELVVSVVSDFDEPVDGGQAVFVAPGSGASLSKEFNFAAVAGGQAALVATANAIAGDYTVVASAAGSDDSATFGLTNLARTFQVTATVGDGEGTITPLSQTVIDGETASFTVTPETGWSVSSVVGDTCTPELVSGDQWQATGIRQACAVEASFAINVHTVTAATGQGEGTITPASQDVEHGSDASFTVTPDTGWSVTSVSGDTCTPVLDSGGQWVAANITEDCAVVADFVQDVYTIGGEVSGLAGAGLALTLNEDQVLPIGSDGEFNFLEPLVDGSDYNVTVSTQPDGQYCSVANGTGTLAGADIDDVLVTCLDLTLGLSPGNVQFADLAPGDSGQQPLVLTNTGPGNLVIESFGTPDAPFGFNAGDCEPLPRVLTPGESCTVMLSFAPTSAGTFDDQLTIVSNALASPSQVGLSGSSSSVIVPVPVPTLDRLALLLLMIGMLALAIRQPRL